MTMMRHSRRRGATGAPTVLDRDKPRASARHPPKGDQLRSSGSANHPDLFVQNPNDPTGVPKGLRRQLLMSGSSSPF
jgi:hypothetical protein